MPGPPRRSSGSDRKSHLPMRREAKVINFGIIYGMSAYGLSQQLGVDPKIAQTYIDEYFKKYLVSNLHRKSLEEARAKWICDDLLHRRRYLPDIHSPNTPIRQATERMAINTPLKDGSGYYQGSHDPYPETDRRTRSSRQN